MSITHVCIYYTHKNSVFNIESDGTRPIHFCSVISPTPCQQLPCSYNPGSCTDKHVGNSVEFIADIACTVGEVQCVEAAHWPWPGQGRLSKTHFVWERLPPKWVPGGVECDCTVPVRPPLGDVVFKACSSKCRIHLTQRKSVDST